MSRGMSLKVSVVVVGWVEEKFVLPQWFAAVGGTRSLFFVSLRDMDCLVGRRFCAPAEVCGGWGHRKVDLWGDLETKGARMAPLKI